MKIFLTLALLIYALPSWAETAKVVEGARVNLRSGKFDTYRVIKALEPGTEVEVLRQEQGYVQVKTEEGDIGWLAQRLVKISPALPKSATTSPALDELKAEIAKAQAELQQVRNSNPSAPASIGLLIGIGLGGLGLGILLGMGGLWAYYRKKLNGLRI